MSCHCPERMADMVVYGVHICKDGQRISHEEYYDMPTGRNMGPRSPWFAIALLAIVLLLLTSPIWGAR